MRSAKIKPSKIRNPIFARPWFICLLLFLSTLAIFSPTVRYDTVNYDDADYVGESNPHVPQGLTKDGFVWAFTTGHASNWHPITWLSHMLDTQIFGDKPAGAHFTNILLHAINALLVFLVLHKMTRALWQSAFVAALFALHPLHVESVAWISERKDVLSTFFWMLTLWAYASYAKAKIESQTTKCFLPYYVLAIFFFALGLMSKPMVVTLPFVLLLLDIWPLRRIEFARENEKLNFQWRAACRLIAEKVPFFALTITASAVTFLVQKKGGAVSSLAALSISSRIENAIVSYLRYIGKMFLPTDLSILYPHPGKWPHWQFIGAILILITVSALSIWLIRRRAYLFVGWFWFLGTLVPVIGIVQVGMQSMADRYTYIPLIGLFIAITWSATEIFTRWNFPKIALGIFAAIILLCSTALTATQISYWKNSETLFGHAIKVTDKNYIAYNNLGFFLSHEDRFEEAIASYHEALKIEPRFEDAHNNIGYAFAKIGNHSEAILHYQMALKIKPELVEAHNNLGNSLAETGKPDEAIEHYKFALSKNPKHADAHNNFGVALAMKGKLDEAVEHFQKSLDAKPGYASAHSNLGNAYAVQGKLDQAMEQYFASLKIKPDDSQAHNNLANVLSQKDRIEEATQHYQKSLELNAKNPEANFNLALLLIQQGKRDEALQHLQEALRLKPDYTEAKRQIAALNLPLQK